MRALYCRHNSKQRGYRIFIGERVKRQSELTGPFVSIIRITLYYRAVEPE